MGLGWTQDLSQNHSFHPRLPATALLQGAIKLEVTSKEVKTHIPPGLTSESPTTLLQKIKRQ